MLYTVFIFRVMKVAKQLKDEKLTVNFAISNIDELGRELDECGLEDRSGDKPFVCAYDSSNKKYKLTEVFRYCHCLLI